MRNGFFGFTIGHIWFSYIFIDMDIQQIRIGKMANFCYLIGDEASRTCALIDPAFETDRILEEVNSREYKVTHIINSHGHSDHTAGNKAIVAATGAKLMIHELDAHKLGKMVHKTFSRLLGGKGSPRADVLLKENDCIRIGETHLKVLHTPGHTPGHICLYDRKKKLLVSGDHILFDITPNITFWPELENSLKMYLASLEKVYDLDVNLVLPGHRSIWSNQKERISELKAHHQARLDEVVFALDGGGKTSFEIAPYITWDIDCSSWEQFPPSQKFFAVGETIAHVEYLEKSGVVCREKIEGKILFSLT